MRYVGLDSHWRQSTICVLDHRGQKLLNRTIKGSWSKVLEEVGKAANRLQSVSRLRPATVTYSNVCNPLRAESSSPGRAGVCFVREHPGGVYRT